MRWLHLLPMEQSHNSMTGDFPPFFLRLTTKIRLDLR